MGGGQSLFLVCSAVTAGLDFILLSKTIAPVAFSTVSLTDGKKKQDRAIARTAGKRLSSDGLWAADSVLFVGGARGAVVEGG
jgi:hypothetical protein